MTIGVADPARRHRRIIYALLIGSSLAWLGIRIALVTSDDQLTPFISANDRSRWCAVRALVDHGTFQIDDVMIVPGWNTIDKVSHLGRDGRQHFYSSKPPLLPIIVAGEYYVLKQITGCSLSERPLLVGRLLVAATNLPLMAIFLATVVISVERWGTTDWGRVMAVAIASWATFLSSFAVTLNNHLPAATGAALCWYAVIRIWVDRASHGSLFALAGFGAAVAAANELPALSLVAVAVMLCAWRYPARTTIWYLGPVLLIAGAFFGANLLAHGDWRPPYAHRVEGEDWRGDNWYNYPESYWLPENRQGVDRGEPNVWKYGFHVVAGHHGLLSLTPIWLISLGGVALLLRQSEWRMIGLGVLGLTLVCLVFFVFLRPPGDRNYGGVTSGFRWMFWLIPLWTFALLPALDRLAENRLARGIVYVLTTISLASVAYGWMHPFKHPWPFGWA